MPRVSIEEISPSGGSLPVLLKESFAIDAASAPANPPLLPIGGKDDSGKYKVAALDVLSVDGRNAARTVLMIFACEAVFNGATWDRWRAANIFKQDTASALGDNAIWTPTTNKKFRLLGGIIQCGATATDVYLKDGTTQISPIFKLTPNQVLSLDALFVRSNGLLSAAANNVLSINLSAANPVAIWVCGTEE